MPERLTANLFTGITNILNKSNVKMKMAAQGLTPPPPTLLTVPVSPINRELQRKR